MDQKTSGGSTALDIARREAAYEETD